jgi:hypothetical protein
MSCEDEFICPLTWWVTVQYIILGFDCEVQGELDERLLINNYMDLSPS